MLATLIDKPFDEKGWTYEVKWDGYRAIAYLLNGNVKIKSRNNKEFGDKFYPIQNALQKTSLNAILDGEIIVAGKNGVSNFGDLQNWRSEADGVLQYYVFDILWYEGYQLTDAPLNARRNILRKVLRPTAQVLISHAFENDYNEFFRAAETHGLEGIMAKKDSSIYLPGIRSKDWLKIKISKRQEVVIGGYTINEGTNKGFSSLLVGVYNGKVLQYIGKVGTGFSTGLQKKLLEKFAPLLSKKCPFEIKPDVNKPSRFRPNPPPADVYWLKPEIVCEVSYAEITSDGVMRHPSFEGLREDKSPKEVKSERVVHPENIIGEKDFLSREKMIKPNTQQDRQTFLNPTEATQQRIVNGHSLKFSNLNKIYWPKEKISKRDMLNYYYQVAPFILPYIKDRPQSLNRFPNGILGASFYQKNVTGKVPGWVATFPYHSETDNEDKNFLVPTDEASLLYMASLGCIEINPWSSRVSKPDNPDWCIIDLDPDNNDFSQVIETARVVHRVLDDASIPSYCKTSGSTGLHIYIPLGAKYAYEDSREFGRLIATLVHEELPEFTSIERQTSRRKRKIYIDFLQNRPQATLACAYSLRPKPGAPVSMPLQWKEVKKGLSIQDFTIHNAVQRLRDLGDIFRPVLGTGINMKKAVASLSSMKK
ncbi:MAG: DNA ligase D [Bacteroidetes bacterium]|nr:MAG: DNA ligase D [Bacteroidota bacterium]